MLPPALMTVISGSKFLQFIAKNWKPIVVILLILISISSTALFAYQLKQTRLANARTEVAKTIAENNLKALNDRTIELLMTREQLAQTDSLLAKVVHELDSLKKNPKTVVIVKPIYIPQDVAVENTLVNDEEDTTKYGLAFNSEDSVRTIKGTSWLTFKNNLIKPDSTVIEEFKLNFGLAIARYDDKENKLQKIEVLPYYINEMGEFTKPISKNLLDLNYRGVELLDVPYEYNVRDDTPPPKKKYSVKTGVTLSLNPIGYGYIPSTKTTDARFGFVLPTVNLGWGIMLVRNR